jgi:hypothetical protein
MEEYTPESGVYQFADAGNCGELRTDILSLKRDDIAERNMIISQ